MLSLFGRCTWRMTSMFPDSNNTHKIMIGSISSLLGLEGTGKKWALQSEGRNASYEDAVEKLLSLTSNAGVIDLAVKTQNGNAEGHVPKMRTYLHRIGISAEHLNKLSVIHVSGTKGKGSTCAFAERILSCHGYTTGLYTSPHLFEVRERIRINGRSISKELFCKYFWSVYTKLKETEIPSRADEGYDMPFFFSFLTVLSFHVFLKEEVDVAIMEVGIGGKYDPTNVVERPIVCGVTALGFDHTNILGNTIEGIAMNKAGIFKKDRPAIVLPQKPGAMQVFLNTARETKSPLYVSEHLSTQELNDMNVRLGIDCDHQAENACLAVQLTDFWMRLHKNAQIPSGIPSSDSSIGDIPRLKISDLSGPSVEGLSTCVWPGRTQTIERERTTYYLDGAHTKESVEVCTNWFKRKADMESLHHGGSVVRILIFNTTGDRDVGLFLSMLKPCNFDVALFCTNQLSTVESFNRPDQYHKDTAVKKMTEKAMANKRIWDQVISWPTSSPMVDTSLDSTTTEVTSNWSEHIGPLDCSNEWHKDESGIQDVPTSLAFPCILHALAWATQGRDPMVRVKDYRGVGLPEAPRFLKEAGHVQILITGSLHLVGGALEALMPDMNQ